MEALSGSAIGARLASRAAQTPISFHLDQQLQVVAAVYDSSGTKVVERANLPFGAGMQSIV